jgi:ComF family protein
LVHLLKYDGIKPLARPLGGLVSRMLPRDERFDVIVPMPLHWRRAWTRGFNQAALLAEEIGRRNAIPIERVIRRVKASQPQAGLTNAQRRTNVSGAFRMRRGRRLDGLRVLLVDDVLTTGATAAACARVLKRAGAAHVALAAVARADRRLVLSYTQEFSTAPLVQAAGSAS